MVHTNSSTYRVKIKHSSVQDNWIIRENSNPIESPTEMDIYSSFYSKYLFNDLSFGLITDEKLYSSFHILKKLDSLKNNTFV